MMTLKLAVFDLAGTTLNDNESYVADAFIQASEDFGIMLSEERIKKAMGYKKREAIQMLLKNAGERTDENWIDNIHNRFTEHINERYRSEEFEEVEGASKVFSELKKLGLRIAINTGFSRSTADIIFSKLDWFEKELVDGSITSDEVERGRPAPDMILELQNRFRLTGSEQIVKVGDTPSDLLEGKKAGCGLTVGVLYGTHNREEMEPYPHDYLIEDIQEITAIVKRYRALSTINNLLDEA
jgi:phosphonatase-like hydrolase